MTDAGGVLSLYSWLVSVEVIFVGTQKSMGPLADWLYKELE